MKILELDNRLKQQAILITQAVSLREYRGILNPPKEAWWWFLDHTLERQKDPLTRFDFIWNFITIILLTISISLGLDIVSRFLSGGLDWLSSLILAFQSLLTIFAASIITNSNATLKFSEQIFHLLNIKQYFYQKLTQIILSILLLFFTIGFRHHLPSIANYFNERGLTHYEAGKVAISQADFERAIGLDSTNAEAHYNLGRLYEEWQDLEKAQEQYRLALRGNLDVAYNALGRLLIQDKKYSEAVSMLLQGLEISSPTDRETRGALFKNLGWARLGQKRYVEAESALREAIELDSELASAHCLLAEVLAQKQGRSPKCDRRI